MENIFQIIFDATTNILNEIHALSHIKTALLQNFQKYNELLSDQLICA